MNKEKIRAWMNERMDESNAINYFRTPIELDATRLSASAQVYFGEAHGDFMPYLELALEVCREWCDSRINLRKTKK